LLNKVLKELDTMLVDLAPGKLSADARAALTSLNTAVITLNGLLAQMSGEKGLAASLQHTSDSLGAMAQNAERVGPAIDDASRDVQAAARAVQRLADALELDPDMLLKGRGKKAAR